jgi:DNA-binding winged helix-turn-helix (wHTH) protein/Flp pilus assembly protein TadD
MGARLSIGEFELDTATRKLRRRGGSHVHLANRPFQVLLHLVANRGRLVTRAELLELFWDGRDVYDGALTRCVSTVRKALDDHGPAPRYVETRWSDGYRFVGSCREERCTQPAPARAASTSSSGRRFTSYSSTVEVAAVERLVERGKQRLNSFGHRNQRYALELFERARALDPDHCGALAGVAASRALLYLHVETTDEHRDAALEAMRDALALDPEHPDVQLARAHVAVMGADYSAADDAFGNAEVIEPRYFRAWYYHGRACAERNDCDRAVTLYERASSADPLDFQAFALAELSFLRLGLTAEARRVARACVAAAEEILRREPDNARALSLGGCVMPGIGRGVEGRGWTERAVALEPDEPYVNLNASCAYMLLGEHERSIDFLERMPMAPWGNWNWVQHDPLLDPLRDMPRFRSLVERRAA